jgi:hypothetical protein
VPRSTGPSAAIAAGHIASHQHRQDREHPFQYRRIETGARRRALRDGATDFLRSEDLAEDVVARSDVRGVRRQHFVHQAATSEAAEHAGQVLESGGLRLRTFLEAPEDRGKQRRCARRRLFTADAEFARDRLDAAGLAEHLNKVLLLHWCLGASGKARCGHTRAGARDCSALARASVGPPTTDPDAVCSADLAADLARRPRRRVHVDVGRTV